MMKSILPAIVLMTAVSCAGLHETLVGDWRLTGTRCTPEGECRPNRLDTWARITETHVIEGRDRRPYRLEGTTMIVRWSPDEERRFEILRWSRDELLVRGEKGGRTEIRKLSRVNSPNSD